MKPNWSYYLPLGCCKLCQEMWTDWSSCRVYWQTYAFLIL